MLQNYPILHICPQSGGGVYDYAELVTKNTPHAELITIDEQTQRDLPEGINCILHYSGYGYAKRGAPKWLVSWLKEQRPRIGKLGIWFHELYATGSPWSSAFWLSPAQRMIARKLAENSDFWISNRDNSADWLSRYAGQKPHATLPVFSNVGESPVRISKPLPKIIIFGGAALRSETYKAAGEKLFAWAESECLEIHDIGPKIDDPVISSSLHQNHVILHGRLEKEIIAEHMSNSMFGIVCYPKTHVSKSGVFASYCAHGVCPILLSDRYDSTDGLIANQHYLAGIQAAKYQDLNSVSVGLSGWQWYQQHAIREHLITLEALLSKCR